MTPSASSSTISPMLEPTTEGPEYAVGRAAMKQHALASSASMESAQETGLVILFPLVFVSNALVPTRHMPTILRVIADWNPVSAVTAAAPRAVRQPESVGDDRCLD